MKKHLFLLLTLAATLVILIQCFLYTRAGASAKKTPDLPAQSLARLSDQISVRAAGRGNPWINLRDGRDLVSQQAGPAELQSAAGQDQATPLSLASADFDGDGTPDLVTAHRAAQGGMLTFYRGNPGAIYPNSAEAKARKTEGSFTDAPFLSPGQMLGVEMSPEFLGAGDFNADGHQDLVAAARGSNSLSVLFGNGRGSFPLSKQIELPGRVTAMIAGEINRADGLADIVVGIAGPSGASVLIFDDSGGAVKAEPESFALPAEAADFALGNFVDDYKMDLAIAAGKELIIVQGRDPLSLASQKKPRPQTIRRQLAFSPRSVATGNFTGNHPFEIGLLSNEGEVLALTPGKVKPKAGRKLSNSLDQWKIEKLSKDRWPLATRLVRARVSSIPIDNLLVIDPPVGQLHIVTGGPKARALKLDAVSMDVEGGPVAAIGMRLNPDALTDLVVLREGQSSPTVLMTAPMNIFAVVDAGDDGPGTLRQAIIDANKTSGADDIIFMIDSGPQTINLASALPDLLETVTIDGTSQPGFSNSPIITVNGNELETDGLIIAGGSSVVRGLAIHNLGGRGIVLDAEGGGGNRPAAPTGGNNIVEGNYIGLDSSGTGGSGIGGDGVFSNTIGNTIGGFSSNAGNVIALTGGDGADIIDGDTVLNNLIGTDATGATALGGSGSGVVVNGSGAVIGSIKGGGNVIAGQSLDGIRILSDGNSAIIEGNFIGTDATGSVALGNLNNGISISNSGSNMIGGPFSGTGNLISGNGNNGIAISGSGATANMVLNNTIGAQADGASPLGNGGNGILIENDASNNVIGDVGNSGENVIAFNGGDGVLIASGTGNAIRGNSIFSNTGLGIDLSPDGVTANDTGDNDSGPNDLQNFPVLTSASVVDGEVTIQGSFNSSTDSGFTFDFYASPACDPSGNGEGQTWIGSANVTTDPSGNATINVMLAASVSSGDVITATATGSAGSTSEFSACVAVSGGGGCVTFDNDGEDGLWENPLNWSGDQLPGPGDNACIPSKFTVTLSSGSQSIAVLTNDGTLIISGGDLFVSAASTSNSLTLNSLNTLSIGDSFTVTGDFNIAGGNLVGAGTLAINNGAVLNFTSGAAIGGLTINNAGTANWLNFGAIDIGDGAVFNNQAGATFNIQVENEAISAFGFMLPGTFNNAGTLRKSASDGAVAFGFDVVFSNTGIVDVQTGTLEFFNGGTNTGNLNVEPGAIIEFSGGVFNINSGSTLTGNGLFNVLTEVAVNASLTVPNLDVIATAIPSRTDARRGLRPGGIITGTLTGTGAVTLTGVGNFTGGTMSGAGTTAINSGAVLNISGDIDKTILRTINNSGTVNWTGQGFILLDNGAPFNNLAGGLFHAQNGGVEFTSFSGGNEETPSGKSPGAFNNAGEFRKTTSTGLIDFTGGVSFINTGNVNVQSGTLGFGSGYTQTAGNLLLNGGNVSTEVPLAIQGGALSGSGLISGSVINGGQVNPGGSPGIINIAGSYTQTPAGVLNIEIGGLTAGTEYDRLNVSGIATLDGTLNLILINSFSPNVGDMFQVLTYGSRSGSFATINGLTIGGGRAFEPTFTANDLSFAVVLGASSDLSVTKTDSPDPVAAGQNITYTIQVSNSGSEDATGIQLDEAVPANTTFQSISTPPGWSCQTPPVGGTGAITCNKSALSPLSTDTITVVVRVNPGTPDNTIINNTVTVTSMAGDPTPGDNTDETTTTVITPACAIICPSNMTVNTGPTQCGAAVNYTVPPAGEECGTITCSPPSGAFFPVGVTTVTCAPIDGAACSFNVTVVDNAPPQIVCPGNISTSTTTSSTVVDYVLATATDNCPGATVICLPPSGTVFPLGANTVNCSATDAAGNTSTCAFTITVNDGRSPTINCPPNIIADATPGQCTAAVTYPDPIVSDPTSSSVVIVCIPPSGSTFPLGTTSVFCSATNQAGNRVSCSFAITVNAPPLVRVTLEGGSASLEPGPVVPPLRQRENPPAGCDCDRTFTIENTGCSPFTLTLSEIARIGADVDRGRITNTNDSSFFSVRLVGADQSETRLNIGSQISFDTGQRRTFRLVFNPVVPAFTGRTTNLSASDALPNPVTSRIVFNPGGAMPLNLVIPINGRVSTGVRLLNPDNSRDNKRVIFTRSGNEFTISLAVFDSNLDVNRIRYEFLDGQGSVVDQAFDIDMTGPISQSDIIRGQSFRVIQRFTGANSRPQITSVRVTVFDAGSNDSFTAQLQSGTTNAAAIQSATGEGTLLLRTLVVGRDSRKF